jgi:hypothetical protein
MQLPKASFFQGIVFFKPSITKATAIRVICTCGVQNEMQNQSIAKYLNHNAPHITDNKQKDDKSVQFSEMSEYRDDEQQVTEFFVLQNKP